MTTTGVNVTLYKGETKHIVGTAISGTAPFDLTSAVIKYVVQQTLADNATEIVYKDTSNGITITNPTQGQFMITINPSDFSNTSAGVYQHLAKLIDSAGDSSIMFIGQLTLQQSSKNI